MLYLQAVQQRKNGKLDNSRPMTFAMAVRTIKELLLRLCVRMENAIVTYYEIGITMKMSYSADCYIRQVQEISDRILWNDANFPEYRQKTTEKSKYFRKVLKVYDKSFEAGEKGRKVGDNILRIETVYRHQSVSMLEFTDYFFLSKMGRIFYKDWSEICFVRELSATKGVKISQLEKAREIHRLGTTRYKERYKQMFLGGKLTKNNGRRFATLRKRGRLSVRNTWKRSVSLRRNSRIVYCLISRLGFLHPFAESYNILIINILYKTEKAPYGARLKH